MLFGHEKLLCRVNEFSKTGLSTISAYKEIDRIALTMVIGSIHIWSEQFTRDFL